MSSYIVCFEMDRSIELYVGMWTQIQEFFDSWVKLSNGVWVIHSERLSADQVFRMLKPHLPGERLVVAALTGEHVATGYDDPDLLTPPEDSAPAE